MKNTGLSFNLDFLAEKTEEQNVIQLLKSDHKKVKSLFSQFEKAEGLTEKRKIAKEIVMELKIHTTLEEEIVYPALNKDDKDASGDVFEAYEEHHLVDVIIAELDSDSRNADQFEARIKVLAEMVKHHIKEEESTVLPKLQKAHPDLDDITQKVLARKQELLEEGIPEKSTTTAPAEQASVNLSLAKNGKKVTQRKPADNSKAKAKKSAMHK